jgi:hypothetical protein
VDRRRTAVLSLFGYGSRSAPPTTARALNVPAAPARTFSEIVHVPPLGNSIVSRETRP